MIDISRKQQLIDNLASQKLIDSGMALQFNREIVRKMESIIKSNSSMTTPKLSQKGLNDQFTPN